MTQTSIGITRQPPWRVIVSISLIGLASTVALRLSYTWLNQPRDLAVYLSSARALIEGHSGWAADTISTVGHAHGYMPLDINSAGLWTPPMAIPFLAPFTLLPFETAAWLWTALNLAIFEISLQLARQWLSMLTPQRWIGLILLFPPTIALLMWGQITGLVLLGYVLFLAFAKQRRDWLAGASLVLVTFKPHLGYLAWLWLVYWVFRHRRWKIIGGLAIGLLLDLGLVFLFNSNWIADYLTAISAPPLSYDASTLMRVLYRVLFPTTPWIQFAGLIVSSIALIIYIIVRHPRALLLPTIPVLLACSVTFAPYGWSYDQLIAWPAYLWLANDLFASSPEWWGWGLLLIPAMLYYIQSGTHWGDNNPLLFWLPIFIVLAWFIHWSRSRYP
jgi:hypothetical protein